MHMTDVGLWTHPPVRTSTAAVTTYSSRLNRQLRQNISVLTRAVEPALWEFDMTDKYLCGVVWLICSVNGGETDGGVATQPWVSGEVFHRLYLGCRNVRMRWRWRWRWRWDMFDFKEAGSPVRIWTISCASESVNSPYICVCLRQLSPLPLNQGPLLHLYHLYQYDSV